MEKALSPRILCISLSARNQPGVQELRSNLLTHVEESFWGERFPEGNCTLHEPFYKADLGLQVEQTPVERIEIEVKVNYFLKKRKGYFSH